jgi:hypothetical protein
VIELKKKVMFLLLVMLLLIPVVSANKWDDVVRLKDQILMYSAGHYLDGTPIPVGMDEYGYNYQAHSFDSYYCNAYLGRYGYPPFEGDLAAYDQRLVDEGYYSTSVYRVVNYGDVSVSGTDNGNFLEIFDLTAGDLVVSFTYDASGMIDDFGGGAHAWAELGVRSVGNGNFNPNEGVWVATDYDWNTDTFDPDPGGSPTQDLDDKIILQAVGGQGEGSYDLPSTPPNPWANHGVWFDRDGVDPFQALLWGAIDGVTYNTGGLYDIVITLHATSTTTGEAYITVNGEDQGFYDPGWYDGTPNVYPAGRSFTGDMTKMQVFYGIWGYGAVHSADFNSIVARGYKVDVPYAEWYWAPDTWLKMKWNDAWLANTDADGDELLDRHYGYPSYLGSGAWLTNHQYPVEGDEWYYFVKIVAVPVDAVEVDGVWYTSDGDEIGTSIWGQFAIIQQVDETGIVYNPKMPSGWGVYQP